MNSQMHMAGNKIHLAGFKTRSYKLDVFKYTASCVVTAIEINLMK